MPDAGATPAIYSARPTIWIDGSEQPGLRDGLSGLLVEETSSGLYRCEATFGNWGPKDGAVGYLYFDRTLLDFGKTIKIAAGGGQAAGVIFQGRITGIEGRFPRERAPEILVLAEDRLQDLRMTRRTRTFEQVDDAALFQQIASQHGLQADVDAPGPTYQVVAQVNQSDLAFLRERARGVDAELWVEDTIMHVQARARRRARDLTLTYREGLHELSVLADLAEQASGFTVSGWDVAAKQGVQFRAAESALAGELNGDQGGSAVLSQSMGVRDQQIVHLLPRTSQEAQALAEASYRRAARRFVVGEGTAEGDARIRVGARLTLENLGPLFQRGPYYVSRARHTFDLMLGYLTQFKAERAGIGR
jgi:Bacteriophage probable baseplate hub protein